MMPKLSIIVPVYNVSHYLEDCVASLVSQQYTDCEIILVDDGSTDSSGMLCDGLADSDKRIIVIHKENGGVSSARNVGIERARGMFVAFVDADDSVESHMYSTMVEKAEATDADYVICGFNEINTGQRNHVLFSLPDDVVLDREGVVNKVLYSIFTSENVINSPCNKLYRKELILQRQLRFTKRRRAEDWLFNIRYLEEAQSAIYINKPLYNYIRNDQSVMSKILPEQYELWKENAQIRREIADRYQMEVNWKEVNKRFLSEAIPWTIAMHKQVDGFSFDTIFNDVFFKELCHNSNHLESKRSEFVREMIAISKPGIARLVCRL